MLNKAEKELYIHVSTETRTQYHDKAHLTLRFSKAFEIRVLKGVTQYQTNQRII